MLILKMKVGDDFYLGKEGEPSSYQQCFVQSVEVDEETGAKQVVLATPTELLTLEDGSPEKIELGLFRASATVQIDEGSTTRLDLGISAPRDTHIVRGTIFRSKIDV